LLFQQLQSAVDIPHIGVSDVIAGQQPDPIGFQGLDMGFDLLAAAQGGIRRDRIAPLQRLNPALQIFYAVVDGDGVRCLHGLPRACAQ
jgi:hypothetical protein